MPAASQCAASAGSYSRNAPNSPQPAGPVDQRDLANGDAAEPNSHRQRDDVQSVEQVRPAGGTQTILPLPRLDSGFNASSSHPRYAAAPDRSRSGTTRVRRGWRSSTDLSPSNSAERRSHPRRRRGACSRPAIPPPTTCRVTASATALCARQAVRRGASGRDKPATSTRSAGRRSQPVRHGHMCVRPVASPRSPARSP